MRECLLRRERVGFFGGWRAGGGRWGGCYWVGGAGVRGLARLASGLLLLAAVRRANIGLDCAVTCRCWDAGWPDSNDDCVYVCVSELRAWDLCVPHALAELKAVACGRAVRSSADSRLRAENRYYLNPGARVRAYADVGVDG